MALPSQPLYVDEHGTVRFRPNALVWYLLENGGIDMNSLAVWCHTANIPNEDRAQFAQLIGYSVSGWGDLSYVADEAIVAADTAAALLARQTAAAGTRKVDGE